jgi:hypothetical protein
MLLCLPQMVQLTDLGASAGFAYTAWSVLGSLHRYIATANKRFDDGTVVDWHATLLAELVSQGDRTETTMGMDPSESCWQQLQLDDDPRRLLLSSTRTALMHRHGEQAMQWQQLARRAAGMHMCEVCWQ